jgi:hypothetical protein
VQVVEIGLRDVHFERLYVHLELAPPSLLSPSWLDRIAKGSQNHS